MIRNISGVILAGGGSRRFNGIIKAKIEIGGKTIISRIIETLDDIFGEIIIVTNSPEEFKEYPKFRVVRDQFLNKGPLAGIHSALKEAENAAAFVFAGDMPLLDRDLIIRQTDVFNSTNCDILVPRIDEYLEPLHAIYRKTLTSMLEDYLNGDHNYAIREFYKMTGVHYLQLKGTQKTRRAFTNINSISDITSIEKLIGLNH